MKLLHTDEHRYVHSTGVRYTHKDGKFIVIRKGDLFYHFTTDKGGNYVSLAPRGSFFKLSDTALATLSERSVESKIDVDVKVLKPSDHAMRTFDNMLDYQRVLTKNKTFILEKLSKFLSPVVSTKVTSLCTVSKLTQNGQVGVLALQDGVTYKLAFYLGINPYFSYSVWVPNALRLSEDHLPVWSRRMSKRIPEIQASIFQPLKLKVNHVNKQRSIVNLTNKKFTGVIYQWSAKI